MAVCDDIKNSNVYELGSFSPKDLIYCSLDGSNFLNTSISPLGVIEFIVKNLSYLALLLSILGLVIGSLKVVESAGNKTKLDAGKNIMLYSILGLILSLTAPQILIIVFNILGYTPPTF